MIIKVIFRRHGGDEDPRSALYIAKNQMIELVARIVVFMEV